MCTNQTNDQDANSDYPTTQSFIDIVDDENTKKLIETLIYLEFPVDQPLIDLIKSEVKFGAMGAGFILSVAGSLDAVSAYSADLDIHWNAKRNGHNLFSYAVHLQYPANPAKDRQQTFYPTNGKGISLLEACNLLQGRAVHKNWPTANGETYNAWGLLNFAEKDIRGNYNVLHYRSGYRYDLEKVLKLYPIEGMENTARKKELIRGLMRGDAVPVSLVRRNKIEQVLIAANPVLKTINIIPLSRTDK